MSVLKAHRGQSKAEFVNTANAIYTEMLWFLSRLSSRYSRLLAKDTIHEAHEIVANAEAANSMMPVDQLRYEERTRYLLRARAAVGALDIQMAHIYELLMLNPEGAFSKQNGGSIPSAEAVEKLDKMAESLGCKLDEETKLLTGVMKYDKQFLAKKLKGASL